MKIVHILNSPNWSGASNYCVQLCRQQILRGHEVLLLTEPGKPLERARSLEIPFDAGIRLNHRNPVLYIDAIRRMKKIFKSFKPDIISSHINEGAWMSGMVARKIIPEAVVLRTRTDIDPPKAHCINRYVYRHWTDHLVVGSYAHKRECIKNLGIDEQVIDVVYGGIDTDHFRPGRDANRSFRKEINASEETVLIALLARLDPVKGHAFALEAFKILANCPVPKKLVILGYESNLTYEWLINSAVRLGIDKDMITFGYRNDIPDILSSVDIGLISSLASEANSRATLEFLASGKPVVATSVGVIPEIVQDGEHGFLVRPGEALGMAEALARLVGNPYLREKMGRSGRRRVLDNFNMDLFVGMTEQVYLKAMARKGRSGVHFNKSGEEK